MARSKHLEGICHICGQFGPLSFEHVPPQKAFNDRPIVLAKFEDAIRLGPDDSASGAIQQQGMGSYTLCGKCNSNTGSWYGHWLVDWCYQAMLLLSRSGGIPTLYYQFHISPLPTIKQIATMFFSVNQDQFRLANQELVQFILKKESKYLSPRYRFFVYYKSTGQLRSIPGGVIFNTNSGRIHFLSEIAFPPFGYVMTINSAPPDDRLYEITHFARYDYGEIRDMPLRLPVLPTHMAWIPGDYRDKKQIYREAVASA